MIQHGLGKLYAIGNPPDYEPTPDRTVAAIARARGEDPLATLYDLMLEDGAAAMLMMPFFNYAEGNHDAIYDMISHPAGGLGAVRRRRALRADLRRVVPDVPVDALGARPAPRAALLAGVHGARSRLRHRARCSGCRPGRASRSGKKADVNVIDMDALTLDVPRMVYDLPAGGRRLVQGARGYDATVVSGVVTRRYGADTGARPGKLLRGVR